jgi:hypothetical protein
LSAVRVKAIQENQKAPPKFPFNKLIDFAVVQVTRDYKSLKKGMEGVILEMNEIYVMVDFQDEEAFPETIDVADAKEILKVVWIPGMAKGSRLE